MPYEIVWTRLLFDERGRMVLRTCRRPVGDEEPEKNDGTGQDDRGDLDGGDTDETET